MGAATGESVIKRIPTRLSNLPPGQNPKRREGKEGGGVEELVGSLTERKVLRWKNADTEVRTNTGPSWRSPAASSDVARPIAMNNTYWALATVHWSVGDQRRILTDSKRTIASLVWLLWRSEHVFSLWLLQITTWPFFIRKWCHTHWFSLRSLLNNGLPDATSAVRDQQILDLEMHAYIFYPIKAHDIPTLTR